MILLKTETLPAANQHLPEPFKQDEIVKYVGENPRKTNSPQFDQQFIQVERMKSKRVETLSRTYFIDVRTKRTPVPQN